MTDVRTLLERTQRYAADFLEELPQRSVAATVDAPTLRKRLGVSLTEVEVPAGDVIDNLVAATDSGHLRSAGGRFFAWVIGGP